jgi:hypothetical protein
LRTLIPVGDSILRISNEYGVFGEVKDEGLIVQSLFGALCRVGKHSGIKPRRPMDKRPEIVARRAWTVFLAIEYMLNIENINEARFTSSS